VWHDDTAVREHKFLPHHLLLVPLRCSKAVSSILTALLQNLAIYILFIQTSCQLYRNIRDAKLHVTKNYF
jgi:hypothetical protein